MKSAPNLLGEARKPAARLDRADDFAGECVEFFADLVQAMGGPRSLGQIYGLLFASPSPLSFGDIVLQLKISKGSASQGLRLLYNLGAVGRSESRDGRREEYTAEMGLRPLVAGVLRRRVEPLLDGSAHRLMRLRELSVLADRQTGTEFTLRRVDQLEQWRRQIKLLLPLLKSLMGAGRTSIG
jgi:DNA-binding transcriptional regulator GbsR (MarR family)